MDVKTTTQIHNTISMLYYDNRGKRVKNIDAIMEYKNLKWIDIKEVIEMLEFFLLCNEEQLLETAIETRLVELKNKC